MEKKPSLLAMLGTIQLMHLPKKYIALGAVLFVLLGVVFMPVSWFRSYIQAPEGFEIHSIQGGITKGSALITHDLDPNTNAYYTLAWRYCPLSAKSIVGYCLTWTIAPNHLDVQNPTTIEIATSFFSLLNPENASIAYVRTFEAKMADLFMLRSAVAPALSQIPLDASEGLLSLDLHDMRIEENRVVNWEGMGTIDNLTFKEAPFAFDGSIEFLQNEAGQSVLSLTSQDNPHFSINLLLTFNQTPEGDRAITVVFSPEVLSEVLKQNRLFNQLSGWSVTYQWAY